MSQQHTHKEFDGDKHVCEIKAKDTKGIFQPSSRK